MFSCLKRIPRGIAQRIAGIMLGKAHPLGQRVKMRSSDQSARSTQFAVTQIIGGDVNNIGPLNFRAASLSNHNASAAEMNRKLCMFIWCPTNPLVRVASSPRELLSAMNVYQAQGLLT